MDGEVEGGTLLALQAVGDSTVDGPHQVCPQDCTHGQVAGVCAQGHVRAVGSHRGGAVEPGILEKGALGGAGEDHGAVDLHSFSQAGFDGHSRHGLWEGGRMGGRQEVKASREG